MPELNVVAKVTRTLLALGDLNINASPYRLAGPQVMGGTVSWDRRQVTSPWVEGDVTVSRRRSNVTEQVMVYVSGTDQANLNTNIQNLVGAFTQDTFTLSITIGSQQYAWDCEAADYSVQFDTPHLVSRLVPVTFNVPRKPVALSGAF
jgi:hypothetical protein